MKTTYRRRIIAALQNFYLNTKQSTGLTLLLQKAEYCELSAAREEDSVNGHAQYLVTVMRHEAAAVRRGRANLFSTLLWGTPKQKLAQTVALRGR